MKRFSLWIVALGLVASACGASGAVSVGPGPSGSPTPGQTPSGAPTGSPSPSPTPTSNRKVTFEVWFTYEGRLFVTKRTEPFRQAVGGLALEKLQAGPTTAERAAGVETTIEPNSGLRIATLAGGVATVEAGPSFFEGTPAEQTLSRAQVVYTLTQFSTIRRVRFADETETYGRKSFEDQLPAILVESPLIGAKVSSPVTVSGTANVFEATVSLRILDENGNEIARTFTTATCGTGCRGDYSVSVPFNVDHQQRGTIEVFESSAKDGSAINVVAIPVTLMP
jgi:Immunoglobulin-like domain of bacterial spore germination/Sporulation and spore germination